MPSRFTTLFDTYDFFGKAIPGIVMLLGLFSLLPADSPLLIRPEEANIKNIAIVILAGAAVGLIFGEGIHNLSINIESAFGWMKEWMKKRLSTISGVWNGLTALFYVLTGFGYYATASDQDGAESEFSAIGWVKERLSLDGKADDEFDFDTVRGRFYSWRSRSTDDWNPDIEQYRPSHAAIVIHNWTRNRIHEIDTGLVSHRRLFNRRLHAQISPYEVPQDHPKIAYERLFGAIDTVYEYDLREEESRLDEFYPILRTHVEHSPDARRANVFQSLYSFCRSMWVILAAFSTTYAILFVYQFEDSIRNSLSDLPTIVSSIATSSVGAVILAIVLTIVGGSIVSRIRLRRNPQPVPALLSFTAYPAMWVLIHRIEAIPMWIGTQIGRFISEIGFTFVRFSAFSASVFEATFQYNLDASKLLLFTTLGGLEAPFILLVFLSTVVFFDASGDYKEHYVEYLVTEFAEVSGEIESPKDFKNVDGVTQDESSDSNNT